MERAVDTMEKNEIGSRRSDYALVAQATVGTLVLVASTIVVIFGGAVAAGMIQYV